MYCDACGAKYTETGAFCAGCGKARSNKVTPSTKRDKFLFWFAVQAAVLISSVVLMSIASNHKRGSATSDSGSLTEASGATAAIASLVYTPHEQTLLTGNTAVNGHSLSWVTFRIAPAMRHPKLVGRFEASGGSANDIRTVLCSEEDFLNFKNGHQARAFYDSGKVTVGAISASLPEGDETYVLAFDNRFSLFSAKTIGGEVTLHYETLGQ